MRKFLLPLTLLAAGCAAPPPAPPSPASAPSPAIAKQPFEAWDVTAAQLELRVYRDGPMQQFAHNHVITSTALRGVIELREPRLRSGFELELPLALSRGCDVTGIFELAQQSVKLA
jgi:hypothetical protein